MANYLLTGVAGFIGSRVAEFLLEDGHAVYGVDNMNHAYDVRLKEYRLGKLRGKKNFHYRKLDISKKRAIAVLSRWLPSEVAGVINLAARAGIRTSLEDPWVYVDTNVIGTLNLLTLCKNNGIPKFLLSSTSSLYAEASEPPFSEDNDTNHPLQPYAASKKGAEAMAHAYHHLYDIDVSILRYFTVYGPAGRPDMVMFRFIKWITEGQPVVVNGDGEQSRGFTYIDDIARGTIEALKPVGYKVINLGGHEVITINQLIRMLEYRIGEKAQVVYSKFHPADIETSKANTTVAAEVLDWKPQVGLEEGMTRMVDWYMQERAWASQIETP